AGSCRSSRCTRRDSRVAFCPRILLEPRVCRLDAYPSMVANARSTLARCVRNDKSARVLPSDPLTDSAHNPPQAQARSTSTSGAAQAADILALGRAALDVIGRALRSSPEVRANRVMARWPLDLEDLLLELE